MDIRSIAKCLFMCAIIAIAGCKPATKPAPGESVQGQQARKSLSAICLGGVAYYQGTIHKAAFVTPAVNPAGQQYLCHEDGELGL